MADPWESEIHFDESLAKGLIESQFPELAPVQLESLGQGWDNVALLVNGGWVFRFPQRDLAKDLMAFESACLGALPGDLPLEVPRPRFLGQACADYPYSFSGYRLLNGVTSCSRELDDVARSQNATALGDFLGRLHRTPIDDSLARALPKDLIRRADLGYRLGKCHESLEELRASQAGFDVDELQRATKELAGATAWQGEGRLTHGDFYARHLLIDDSDSVCGVIDWGDVHLGDPALDLSIAYTFLPASARADFEAAYGGIDEDTRMRARFRGIYYGVLLTNYGRKVSDGDIRRIGEWALAHALD